MVRLRTVYLWGAINVGLGWVVSIKFFVADDQVCDGDWTWLHGERFDYFQKLHLDLLTLSAEVT